MSISNSKPVAGQAFPVFNITLATGDTQTVGAPNGRWQLIVVYRGKHCGRCKKYLGILENMQSEWKNPLFSAYVQMARFKLPPSLTARRRDPT